MRVAIVNDLALAREVLRRLVQSAPGYSLAWTAADGAEAVSKAAADRPDAILMDLIMPVMDGAEATRRIMAQGPCPILIVTSTNKAAIDISDTPSNPNTGISSQLFLGQTNTIFSDSLTVGNSLAIRKKRCECGNRPAAKSCRQRASSR